MANAKPKLLLLVLFMLLNFVFSAFAIQESKSTQVAFPYHESATDFSPTSERELLVQGRINEQVSQKIPRRMMIGSTAPTCTYNECRGCRFKCRAEQVPVEGNDPINSAYHYRCVCHR